MAFGVLAGAARGQDDRWRLEVVGGWGGTVNAVDVDETNQIAYVGAGQRLVILDISNMAEPAEIGSINLLSSVEDVKVTGGHAYVATSFEPYRFCVVDVSDPAAPALLWYDPVRPPPPCLAGDGPREVDLHGDVAYVRDSGYIVSSYDISDPTDVRLIANVFGLCFGLGGQVRAGPQESMIVGDLMYMTSRPDSTLAFNAALRIYDLSVSPPELVGDVQFGPDDVNQGMTVDGDYAYVVTRAIDRVLHVIDIAAPHVSLEVKGRVQLPLGTTAGIAARDGFVYVPNNQESITIVDATDPMAPSIAGTYGTRGGEEGIVIAGDTAYVRNYGEGLLFLDLAVPAAPVRIGHYHSPAALRQIVKQGDLLYVSDYWNGFSVLDVSDPARPDMVGVYQSPSAPNGGGDRGIHGIAVDGVDAFLCNGHAGTLEAVDVTVPAAPSLRTAVDSLFRPQGLAVSRDGQARRIAHVGTPQAIVNIDVTQPLNMSQSGQITFSGNVPTREIVVNAAADVALVGRDASLVIAELTSAAARYNGTPNPATDVSVEGTLLGVASTSANEVHLLNVSDPASPVTRSVIDSLNVPLSLDLVGDRLFVSATGPYPTLSAVPRLHVFDVADPESPNLLASTWGVAGNAAPRQDVLADEPYVYTVGSNQGQSANTGLVIFDSRCAPDCDQSSGAGVLDVFDFLCFQDAFVAMDPYADCDGNATFDIFDFLCFQDAFTRGCP